MKIGIERIFRHLEEHFDEHLEKLRELCRQPSVAAQGLGMAEVAQMVKELLEGLGAETRLIETSGYPVVYGELAGRGEKTLAFYNHYDVQPPEPLEEWSSDPFSAEVREGRLFARGAADNKGLYYGSNGDEGDKDDQAQGSPLKRALPDPGAGERCYSLFHRASH